MSEAVHVLSLGYSTELLSADKSTSDGANRRQFFASNVGSYTMIPLTRKKEGHIEARIGNIHVIPTNGLNILHALLRMYLIGSRLCRDGKINVIQTQEATTTGIIGFILKVRYRLPISICVFGPNPWDRSWSHASVFNRLITPIARFILRRAECVIADGSLTIDRLQDVGISNNKLVLKVNVPSNILDFTQPDGTKVRQKLLGKQYSNMLLSVGSMSVQKNVPFVLQVFKGVLKDYPQTLLLMIGRGRRKVEYRHLASELGIEKNIIWIDNVPHSEIPSYFAASDIVLLGSRFEGFPRVFLEAATVGRPIVTTKVSGCTDGVNSNETGFVLPQNDLSGFVMRVNELLCDKEMACRMGASGQALVGKIISKREYFNRKQIKVWESLLQRNNPGVSND